MLPKQTLQQLRQLKLTGMAEAFELQLNQPGTYDDLSFEERLAQLIAYEITYRENKRLHRLLRAAQFKQSAQLQNLDYSHPRGLQKKQVAALQTNEWIIKKRNILLTGPTGSGKTYLACALGHHACEHGYSVKYYRASRFLESLTIAHADGTYLKLIRQLAKTDLLILDDWGIDPLSQSDRNDLLEIMEDRHDQRSTIVISQLPITKWHTYIGDATLADAILDRLIHNSHKMKLKGDSMRKKRTSLTQSEHLD